MPITQANETAEQKLFNGLMRLALEQIRDVTERRPQTLECDVWRFQNKKEKWVAFVGLLDGRPYEIFTGLQDDDEGIVLPKSVNAGWIVKNFNADGSPRYDFSFENRRGYKTTVERTLRPLQQRVLGTMPNSSRACCAIGCPWTM